LIYFSSPAALDSQLGDFLKKGVVIYHLQAEEADHQYSCFQNASCQWAEDMQAKDLPGKGAIKILNEECKKGIVRCVAFPDDRKKE
jgi:hypothetical protein